MNRSVTPLKPCRNCRTTAPCIEVQPPPRLHSGWECSACSEIRWGGVVSAGGPEIIGYTFSRGCVLCWRCHRVHTQLDSMAANMEQVLVGELPLHATSYPTLSYLSGFMMALYEDSKEPFERCCDECGTLVAPGC